MRKCLLYFLSSSLLATSYSQQKYWQQQVNYTIDVTLDDKNHSLKGNLKLEYINNSPDKLEYIWFHAWPNAYKNENTAFAKQVLKEEDGKKKLKALKDKGYMDGLDFTVNDEKAKFETDPANIDILKLQLPTSLSPGGKITIATPFTVKLPTYISRSGRIDQFYMICQWYPKPAVYDHKGWHPIPYLDQGEFYSEFGSFTVNITAPSEYVIAATGTMQNENELNHYKNIGTKNLSLTKKNNVRYTALTKEAVKTISYKAENVHDFAWFADKDFIIEYDTMQLRSGKVVDVFTYHPHYGNELWDNSVGYTEDAVRKYSEWVGEYPYPVVQAVEGPKNLSSGGMEYPMITLITSPDADELRLDAVITHEVGHNWFYAILASNERDHAWMDEGLNTYFQFRYEHQKYKANSIFGNAIPADIQTKPLDEFEGVIYMTLANIPMDKEIDLPADQYTKKDEYGMVVYLKTAIWVYMIELFEGKENLDKAFRDYFNEWKFKHPYPEDLKNSFERSMGKKLDQYFDLLKKQGTLR